MLKKQELILGLLLEKLANTKVGILVKGISGISPKDIAKELAIKRNAHIYMAAVGYGLTDDIEKSEYTLTPLLKRLSYGGVFLSMLEVLLCL